MTIYSTEFPNNKPRLVMLLLQLIVEVIKNEISGKDKSTYLWQTLNPKILL